MGEQQQQEQNENRWIEGIKKTGSSTSSSSSSPRPPLALNLLHLRALKIFFPFLSSLGRKRFLRMGEQHNTAEQASRDVRIKKCPF